MAKPIWFSQPEVVLLSILQNLGEKEKECSREWLVNMDPGLLFNNQSSETSLSSFSEFSIFGKKRILLAIPFVGKTCGIRLKILF